MKVMVGVDDSPFSQAALEYVRKTPWPADTTIVVVSSVALPRSAALATSAPAGFEPGPWLDALTKVHEEVLSRDGKLLESAGLKVESRLLQGDPGERIVEEAKKREIDLIVVGSHGRTGLGKLVMGSVASHVVTHAPCSVLVVRPGLV
jgi:nucleotide-binding universal stress UspA family protein